MIVTLLTIKSYAVLKDLNRFFSTINAILKQIQLTVHRGDVIE